MSHQPVIRGDALPVRVSGSRHPLWWGMIMLILIEFTVFASLIVSYFYYRAGSIVWPLGGIERPSLLLPTIGEGLVVLSGATIYWGYRGIKHGNRRRLMIGLALSWLLAAVFLLLKVIEYSGLDYRWDTNAYGSLVWTINGFHAGHTVSVMIFTTVVFILAWQGYFRADRYLGVQINTLYWLYVVIVSLPVYATIYLSPYVL
jgi:cytochrome c oxidase subunit III